MKDFFLVRLLPLIIAPIIYLYSRTWRWRILGDAKSLERFVNNRESVVYAHWHGDELALVPFYSYKRLSVLSSLSKDGTIMANVLSLLGYRVFRGSSSRGGARGLLGLIHSVQNGAQAALAVDGPKGPIYEVKPGIVELAQRTNKPVVVVGVNAKSFWKVPRAWNRSFIPKPFSVVEVYFSEIVYQSSAMKYKKKSDTDLQSICRQIKQKLDSLPCTRY